MKEKVIVFGVGSYFRRYEQELKKDYEVVAYVDNYKYGKLNNDGKDIIMPNQIKEYEGKYRNLIIMLEKVALNMEVAKQLVLSKSISASKIKIGLAQFDFYNELNIAVLEDGRWDIQFSNVSIIVCSEMEFWDLYSMYYEDNYFHKLNNSCKDVIIDIGMNIGDSVIYYLCKPDTEKVYGFEPFLQTFLQAKENIERNHFTAEQFEIFQYGLSDHDEKKNIFYHPEISIMLSTDSNFSVLERRDYEKTHRCTLENIEEEIEIRKASYVIGEIIKKHPNNNIVLKIDCEGEEYAILKDLDAEGILKKVSYITLEWHYDGKEEIECYFDRNGFSYCGRIIRKNLGQMIAWKQNERIK